MTRLGNDGDVTDDNEFGRLQTFHVTEHDDDERCIVTFGGELDAVATASIRPLIGRAPASAQVVVDVRDVTFVDSVGLRFLLEWREHLRGGGGSLCLRNLPHNFQRLLFVTALEDAFVIDEP